MDFEVSLHRDNGHKGQLNFPKWYSFYRRLCGGIAVLAQGICTSYMLLAILQSSVFAVKSLDALSCVFSKGLHFHQAYVTR